jgi:hypothetical protein
MTPADYSDLVDFLIGAFAIGLKSGIFCGVFVALIRLISMR